jgi:hypothetical protein
MVCSVQFLQSFPRHMGIYLGGRYVAVPEQHLNHSQVSAMIEQMSGKGMP